MKPTRLTLSIVSPFLPTPLPPLMPISQTFPHSGPKSQLERLKLRPVSPVLGRLGFGALFSVGC